MTKSLKLPALQPESAEARQETDYPGEYKNIVAGRARRALGDALGLSQFGVNSVHLAPGRPRHSVIGILKKMNLSSFFKVKWF